MAYTLKLNLMAKRHSAIGLNSTVNLACLRWVSTRRSNLPKLARNASKQVADGVSPTQARQLDKIRKVNDASNTFELIAKEWLQMKDCAEITKMRRLDMLE